jgi:hypothetical protein
MPNDADDAGPTPTSVGILVASYTAVKASRLSPIEAPRYK